MECRFEITLEPNLYARAGNSGSKDVMSNLEHREENGGANLTPPEANQPQSWPKKVLMYCIVLPLVLFWETTKGLYKRTYENAETGAANLLNLFIGVVLSLIAGICMGYKMGWSATPAPLTTWLSAAVGASAAMFFYGWTLSNVVVFKYVSRGSKWLWQRVNISGQEYEANREGLNNPAWLSSFLILAARVVIMMLTVAVVYMFMVHVQGHQNIYGVLGYLIGFASVVVGLVAVIFIILWTGRNIGGFLAFLMTVFILLMLIFNWTDTVSLLVAPYNGLTAAKWGGWGFLPGLVLGGVAGVLFARLLWKLLKAFGVPLIAVICSAAGTYFLLPATTAWLNGFAHRPFDAALVPYMAAVVEFFVLVGYVFPILHIGITHSLKHLENITKLMDSVYQEEEGGYREFFLMVVTLAATLAVVWYTPSLLLAYVVTKAWQAYAITAVIGIGVYTLGGSWLLRIGVLPFAMVCAAAFGFQVYDDWNAHDLWFGIGGAIIVGVIGAAATIAITFPLAYILIRKSTEGWLASALRNPLVNLHTRICDGIARFVTEFFRAARNTYGDATPFRETFQQLANIAFTVAATYASWSLVTIYGFALWLGIVITAAIFVLAYTLVGQLFKKKGNGYLGLLAAIVGGVYIGIIVHGAQPLGYWLSVPGALLGAALTAGAFFPWAYLFLRLALNALSQEKWLHPALVNAHSTVWNRFANLREDFLKTYRQVRDSVILMKENFWRTYEEMRAQIFKNRK